MALASRVGQLLLGQGQQMATAESCTGGLLGSVLTQVPGSSQWFVGGMITYSNVCKQRWLGVPEALLLAHGAVSSEVAQAMASGLQQTAGVSWTVAITGVAGPSGGTPNKPVGTVWLAWGTPQGVRAQHLLASGDREAIRTQAVRQALTGLMEALTDGVWHNEGS